MYIASTIRTTTNNQKKKKEPTRMMHLTKPVIPLLLPLLSLLVALPTPSLATPTRSPPSHLWATHYDGHIYTLTLNGTDLSISDKQRTCGGMPSWLTFDSAPRVLYCSDESGSGPADADPHGSLTAYRADLDGTLHQIATTGTVGGGVNSVIYESDKGGKYIAIAHYEGSAISTYSLPLQRNARAQQAFHFDLTRPGAVAQQDAPHPHEVIVDPTGAFLISPDLGMDVLHVYAIDAGSGQLKACPSVNVTVGSGPRHAVFWTDGTDSNATDSSSSPREHQPMMAAPIGQTMMYLVNEIGGTMMVFDVAYARSGCLTFQQTQTLVPYTNGTMPDGATPAEIRRLGDTFYVSIRSDHGFPPNDSMVTLDRAPRNGSVSLRNKTPAYGTVPRTFAINRAGSLVAIGNQASSTVAIVRRNRETGDLEEQVAVLQVGEPGKVGTAEGLSSVVWDE